MKNIQKIADEIFKAPTQEELVRRAFDTIPFISREKILPFDDEHKISARFPNGAYYVTDHDRTPFALVNNYFIDKVKHWTYIEWQRIRYSLDWYRGKLKGKNVVRADMRGNVPVAYYFEKGIF